MHVLRTPVNITLRRLAHGSDAVSATWNFSLGGGQGGWQSDGCRVLGHYDNFTTISCNSLGNYGLLMVGGADHGSRDLVAACLSVCVPQDLSSVEFFSPSIRPLHPVIYATAVVLLLCLLAIVVTYAYHHR